MGPKQSHERIFFSLKSPFLRGVERHVLASDETKVAVISGWNGSYASMGPVGYVRHLDLVMGGMPGAQWVRNDRLRGFFLPEIPIRLDFFLGGLVPYRDPTAPCYSPFSFFLETAEMLTLYLGIILFENVLAQITYLWRVFSQRCCVHNASKRRSGTLSHSM